MDRKFGFVMNFILAGGGKSDILKSIYKWLLRAHTDRDIIGIHCVLT